MLRVLSDVKLAVTGMLAVLLLPGCDDHRKDAGYWEIEREKIELEQQLKLLEYKAGRTGNGSPEELPRLENTLRELGARKISLLGNRSALVAGIRQIERQSAELGRLEIQDRRMDSLGRKFDSLALKDGRTFQNVAITGIDDGGVAIRHEDGAARLRYAELSPEQCALFGLEESAALAAENRERRESIAYERQLDEEMEVLRDKEERAASIASWDDHARADRHLLARESAGGRTSPLAQPATTVGAGSWRGYSRYRSHRPTYRYVHYYPVTPNPFYSSRVYRDIRDGKDKVPGVK